MNHSFSIASMVFQVRFVRKKTPCCSLTFLQRAESFRICPTEEQEFLYISTLLTNPVEYTLTLPYREGMNMFYIYTNDDCKSGKWLGIFIFSRFIFF